MHSLWSYSNSPARRRHFSRDCQNRSSSLERFSETHGRKPAVQWSTVVTNFLLMSPAVSMAVHAQTVRLGLRFDPQVWMWVVAVIRLD